MNKPSIQALLQEHIEHYLHNHRLDGQRIKVCRHLIECHTAALGGLQYACDYCETMTVQYHSCRDRHCRSVSSERALNGVKASM